MAEVMFGNELLLDRVIPVEKLYEILNEHGINYSFPAQYKIENNAFAVVRCKDCKFMGMCSIREAMACTIPDGFCWRGERKDDG